MFCGICNLNLFFAWNISTIDVPHSRMVKRNKFYAAVAQELIDYQVTQSGLGELWQEDALTIYLPFVSNKALMCYLCFGKGDVDKDWW